MSVLNWILYIFIAILMLMFMIMVHEFGHYTAGKLLKFKINEFSIGFGKAIFSKKKKDGEVFSIRLVPLGGYCAFEGEDEENQVEGAFNRQAPWKRLIVLFMGPFFNFLTAIIFSVILLMSFGYSDRVQVMNVTIPENISSQEGFVESDWLQKGDVITGVDGRETNLVYDEYFTLLIQKYSEGEDFLVTVKRNGEDINLTVSKNWFVMAPKTIDGEVRYSLDNGLNYNFKLNKTAEGQLQLINVKGEEGKNIYTADATGRVKVDSNSFLISENNGELTLSNALVGIQTQNYKYGFFEAIKQSFVFCFEWAIKILIILGQLITGQLGISSLGGTVTTVVTIAQASHQNLINLLLLIPLISINLAVFNLLPFPALDGARMVFVAIEGVRGKPINRKVEGMIHSIGLMILLGFVLVVDILHFIL